MVPQIHPFPGAILIELVQGGGDGVHILAVHLVVGLLDDIIAQFPPAQGFPVQGAGPQDHQEPAANLLATFIRAVEIYPFQVPGGIEHSPSGQGEVFLPGQLPAPDGLHLLLGQLPVGRALCEALRPTAQVEILLHGL